MAGSNTRKKEWADKQGTAAAQRWAAGKRTSASNRGGRRRR